ncbi:hypothetical protein B296_00022220 [Ensete ventricosum]|uniref:Uncharacterized protein n=1 Tax=Ensete ventricosum TaxID=4639 RepID=A0A427AT21_ENSVE|nr:hypothetical protein B296_00022220 [Ensete ventricosum]
MGSISRGRNLGPGAGAGALPVPCGRVHQIGALALIVATFLLTRAFDRLSCGLSYAGLGSVASSATLFDRAGTLFWPDRGYGSRLDLKIYVYEEQEIDGLRELMRGRDGGISPDACVKGQWGTQVCRLTLFSYIKIRINLSSHSLSTNCFSSQDSEQLTSRKPISSLFRHMSNGDRTDKRDISAFNTWKDIIIPGNVDDGMTKFYGSNVVQPIPLSKRKHLANFLGRAQGKVGRLQLLEIAKQYPDKVSLLL